jgi:23S rRNA (guanosine2251-2'-O)-methyltransferase
VKKEQLIFGIHPIEEAIEEGKTIEKIFLLKGDTGEGIKMVQNLARNHDIPFQYVPYQKLDRLTKSNHQGAIAVLSAVDYHALEDVVLEVFEKGDDPFILLLDGITDVRNFGAIARSAQAAGVHAIVVPNKGAAPINEDAIKTSAGALLKIPICKEAHLADAAYLLQQSGIRVISLTEEGKESIYDKTINGPVGIIMGNEDKGISKKLLKISDETAHIPMPGNLDSLNVSVATGVTLFEIVRQRLKG